MLAVSHVKPMSIKFRILLCVEMKVVWIIAKKQEVWNIQNRHIPAVIYRTLKKGIIV